MPWTEEEVFDKTFIEEPCVLVSEHRFNLRDIATSISVRIYKHLSGPSHVRFSFETSHFIHTPEQASPYTPGTPWYDDAGYALHRAVDSIASYYQSAVEAGHQPTLDWLVSNEFY